MLQSKAFDLSDEQKQQQIIAEHPLATVINTLLQNGMATVDAQHIPLIWHSGDSGQEYLHGHIARINPLWESNYSEQSLCIFHGPQVYITPNWYPTIKTHGKAVPTWNYAVVHVKGKMTFRHDKSWKRKHLETLTKQMETTIEKGQTDIWQLSDAPEDYIERLLDAIVGIVIRIDSMTAQLKASQNQPQINYENIIEHLKASPQTYATKMAALMEDR